MKAEPSMLASFGRSLQERGSRQKSKKLPVLQRNQRISDWLYLELFETRLRISRFGAGVTCCSLFWFLQIRRISGPHWRRRASRADAAGPSRRYSERLFLLNAGTPLLSSSRHATCIRRVPPRT